MSTSAALLDQGRALPGVAEGTHSWFPARHVGEAVFGVLQSDDHDTAIDEGFFVGTRTGALITEEGLDVPPTGRSLRPRGCDIVTVEDGVAVSHRHEPDQPDLMSQLGLMESREDTGRHEGRHRRHVRVTVDRSQLEARPVSGSSTGVPWRAATGCEAAVPTRCPAPLPPVRPA
jgi:hypothetical protein